MITARNILGFSMTSNMQRVMSVNGNYASIMRAEKQTKNTGKLPTGIPIPVLPVDYLLDKPDFWIGGEGSYVCPIESDWAIWFNWQMNNSNTAVLSSVKGMNPITGQRINGIGLEQYKNKCPIHNCDFLHGKFCPECNFKWPDQNYICSPSPMYLDGFRSEDGTVRQFYFTEDMTKSIPELVIGKDDTVPAFGFCFYKLQNDNKMYEAGNRLKDIPQQTVHISSAVRSLSETKCMIADLLDGFHSEPRSASRSFMRCTSPNYFSSCEAKHSVTTDGISNEVKTFYASSVLSSSMLDESYILNERSIPTKLEVGVGAGVQIKQSICSDNREITEWKEKPAGIIRLYFVFREEFEKYVSSGLRDLTGYKDGFLNGLPVGGEK